MPTPHNEAKKGEIAKTVLICGDPLRAKFIAENYLENAKLVNTVRNMYCYTGKYHGKEVSVASSGMGNPSMAIYSHELYSEYDVDTIIRIGTAGSYNKDVQIGDIVLEQGASTDSNFANQFDLNGTLCALADFELLNKAYTKAKEANYRVHAGNVLASDIYYEFDQERWKKWADLGVLAIEMEGFGLYLTAARLHKKALVILSISNSFITKEETSPETRQTGFTKMMELALNIASEE